MKKYIIALSILSVSMSVYPSEMDQEFLNKVMKNMDGKEGVSDFVYLYTHAESPEARESIIRNGLPGHLKIEHECHKKGTVSWETFKNIMTIKQLAKPQTVAVIGGTALSVFAAWHLTSLIREVVGHHVMIPPLAQKTSIRSWGSFFKRFFVYKGDDVAPRSEIVFNEELRQEAEDLTLSIINAAENDTFFRHCMLYGPAGTGKTMLAMAIAQEAGLEYVYFSAAKLCQYSLEEGIKQLTHLFEYAKNYPKKLMIIMDEADALFVDRNANSSTDKVQQFLNHILTYTGTEQSDYVIISITNRPHVFDSASLSRFGEQIFVGAPALPERKELFLRYAKKYFVDSHEFNRDRRAFYQKLFTEKPKERKPLMLDEEVTSDAMFDELAEKSDGLVGRDISDIMLGVQNNAYATIDLTIRKDMILRALTRKKFQQEQKLRGFSFIGTSAA